MHSIICDAIRTKRLIRFIYDGYERIVEPHLYGISTANNEMLSGWLVGGWSESRSEPGWRNYLVRDMQHVHALADRFDGPRPRYNAFDPQVRQVFCRLEPAGSRAAEDSSALADVAAKRDGVAERGRSTPPAADRRAAGIPPGE